MRVLARHVPVLGGAAGAVAGARAGRRGLQRLGGFLAGVGGPGLEPTLQSLGLSHLVGLSRFDVLDELLTMIAGEGDDLDSWAARDAVCDVLEELFADADAWEDLASTTLSAEDVESLLEIFLARYIYNRIPVIAERIGRLTDPEAMRRADQEMLQVVRDLVAIHLEGRDPLTIDWAGSEGEQIVEAVFASAYETLAALEGGEE